MRSDNIDRCLKATIRCRIFNTELGYFYPFILLVFTMQILIKKSFIKLPGTKSGKLLLKKPFFIHSSILTMVLNGLRSEQQHNATLHKHKQISLIKMSCSNARFNNKLIKLFFILYDWLANADDSLIISFIKFVQRVILIPPTTINIS